MRDERNVTSWTVNRDIVALLHLPAVAPTVWVMFTRCREKGGIVRS